MTGDLTGRWAIVCASSRGLGRGCAIALAAKGANLVINGRDAEALQETESLAKAAGAAHVKTVIGDLSTSEVQQALLSACPEPDILVNNNGGPPRADLADLTREKMLAGLIMNFIVPVELVQAVLPAMQKKGWGRIINITSGSVKAPIPGLDLSSGARAGLTAFLAGVARDVAKDGVTINHLLPGKFETDRLKSNMAGTAERLGKSFDEQRFAQMASVPAKRFGTIEEFGAACAFLASPEAGYITGQSLLLDGGLFPGAF
jgi:3-oxoacyl-[acyl-carrier protein] reductase